jgi:hypothetical protein
MKVSGFRILAIGAFLATVLVVAYAYAGQCVVGSGCTEKVCTLCDVWVNPQSAGVYSQEVAFSGECAFSEHGPQMSDWGPVNLKIYNGTQDCNVPNGQTTGTYFGNPVFNFGPTNLFLDCGEGGPPG